MPEGLRSKYFGADGVRDADLYGQEIAGFVDGIPVRGRGALLTRDNLTTSCDFRARWFRTWDADDVAAYLRVQDHIANGDFIVRSRTEVPATHDGEPSLKIWLEWVQLFADRGGDEGAYRPLVATPESSVFLLEPPR